MPLFPSQGQTGTTCHAAAPQPTPKQPCPATRRRARNGAQAQRRFLRHCGRKNNSVPRASSLRFRAKSQPGVTVVRRGQTAVPRQRPGKCVLLPCVTRSSARSSRAQSDRRLTAASDMSNDITALSVTKRNDRLSTRLRQPRTALTQSRRCCCC